MKRKSLILFLLAGIALAACVQIEDLPHGGGGGGAEKTPEEKRDSVLTYNTEGYVTSGGKGIPGVVVSDGILVAKTDSSGYFRFFSSKKERFVFISIPSGYEAPSKGVQPQFYKEFKQPVDTPERMDFELSAVDQSECEVFLLGDMHLAKRMRDLEQFDAVARDIDSLRRLNDKRKYLITLGDMAWDAYWNKFNLNDYLALMNSKFPSGIQFFHTIGNHDHELREGLSGDIKTVDTYKKILGPTYYSFNIGGVHFVSLDNIVCRNAGTQRSSSNSITADQMNWLKKDLAEVPATTTVVLTMHAPLHSASGSSVTSNADECVRILNGHKNSIVASGHFHTTHNLSYTGLFEMCCGAVCAAWWTTGYDWPGLHMCSDGAPGGYKVMNISDGAVKDWYYKAAGHPGDFQFRLYDRNCININADIWHPYGVGGHTGVVADGKPENVSAYRTVAADYSHSSSANEVLINVWDWDPAWTITVREDGKSLKVNQITTKRDPLYVGSYEAYSYLNNYVSDYGRGLVTYYSSSTTNHLFSVTASSASSTLDIEVTDRFGHKYRQTMTRPMRFVIDDYR